MEEHRASNADVGGSSPSPSGWNEKFVAVVSTVACILAMDKVSGSNPASDFLWAEVDGLSQPSGRGFESRRALVGARSSVGRTEGNNAVYNYLPTMTRPWRIGIVRSFR